YILGYKCMPLLLRYPNVRRKKMKVWANAACGGTGLTATNDDGGECHKNGTGLLRASLRYGPTDFPFVSLSQRSTWTYKPRFVASSIMLFVPGLWPSQKAISISA